ncbi:hypothetical protein ABPG72_014006 [Tetrahymena utriculariae]
MNNNITTQTYRDKVKQNPNIYEIWEQDEEIPLTRTNALRNKPQNSTIFEEQNNPKQQMIQQSQQYQQDKYYQSGSINYYKNDYNQMENDYNSNIRNFRDVQQQNTQTYNKKDEIINNNQQIQNQNEKRNQQQRDNNEQMRRNNRERRETSSNSRYSETNSYRTRNSESNSRSNSRYRRNNNQYYPRRNRRNGNQYYNPNRNNRYQYNNQQNRNQQQNDQQISITNINIKNIEEKQETTCRYWKNRTCRNYECERKHFQMIQLMNLYYKPKSRRIKNNIQDQKLIEDDIKNQKFNIKIEITREMKIEEIQEYITQNVQKLEELKISNLKIMMAVKDNRKINNEIEYIKNQKKEQNKPNNLEMEVEDNNNVRISQTITSFKPIIQDSQFNNAFIGQQINQSQKEIKFREQIITSEEDKVNKQNTSSSEENKIQIENMSPQQALEMLQKEVTQNKQPIDWSKHKVDTSCLVAQENPDLLTESLLIIEQQRISDQIAFVKINNKMIFKEYLTEWGIDLGKQTKEIPTGAYLIMLLDGNHINELKIRFTQATDQNRLNKQIIAYAESISVHAFSTIAYKIESERVKLEGSKQELTKMITEILLSKQEHVQDEIKQIRIQVLEQQYNINIIVHVTVQMKQSRKNLEKTLKER